MEQEKYVAELLSQLNEKQLKQLLEQWQKLVDEQNKSKGVAK